MNYENNSVWKVFEYIECLEFCKRKSKLKFVELKIKAKKQNLYYL